MKSADPERLYAVCFHLWNIWKWQKFQNGEQSSGYQEFSDQLATGKGRGGDYKRVKTTWEIPIVIKNYSVICLGQNYTCDRQNYVELNVHIHLEMITCKTV